MKEKQLTLKMNVYHHMSWWDRVAYYRTRLIDKAYLAAVVLLVVYLTK